MSSSFYVYELYNPLNGELFYVGKGTKRNVKNTDNQYYRLKEHIRDTRYYKKGKFGKTRKYTMIAKILDAGKEPIIKIVFESSSEIDVRDKEIELIAHYGRLDTGTGPLVNHTNGGEGMLGYKHTDSHKNKLRNDNPGGKATARKIVSICIDTFKVVKHFDSSSQASMELTGNVNSKSNINAACRHYKNRIYYGFYWRYEDEYDPNEDFKSYQTFRDTKLRNFRTVLQLDSKGIIKEWKSVNDICKEFKASPSTIREVIKSGREWKGYTWEDKS